MGIYNRSYMRDFNQPSQRPWAIKALLITMIGIFLLQNIARHWFGSLIIEDFFALATDQILRGFIFTPLTYGFLHSTESALPWHLVFNALFIWWFGKLIEDRYGSAKTMELFLFCTLTGGIIWLCFQFLAQQNGFLVGASAGAYGFLTLFCRFHWYHPLSFFFIPIQFTGKNLFYIIAGFQAFFFLFSELPGNLAGGTAYSAHLGGIAGAFIFERYLAHLPPFASWLKRPKKVEVFRPKWESKASKVKEFSGNYTVNFQNSSELKDEVDRILDKINANGFGSLTNEEKETLDRAKDFSKKP